MQNKYVNEKEVYEKNFTGTCSNLKVSNKKQLHEWVDYINHLLKQKNSKIVYVKKSKRASSYRRSLPRKSRFDKENKRLIKEFGVKENKSFFREIK